MLPRNHVLFSVSACVVVLSVHSPARSRSGFEAADLAPIVEGAIARWASDERGPGGVIGITRDGRILLERAFGAANLDHAIANAPDTVFDIGSTSKQFTAAATMMLAIEGRLSLDDVVTAHLPELDGEYEKTTIRHLLHHTSGIRDYLALLALDGRPDSDWTTAEDALLALKRQRGLCFEPGTFHEYSNSGYFLLAQIVERVSGGSFAGFCEERFFRPLGMHDTHVHDDRTRVVTRRATSYAPIEGGKFAQLTSGYEQTGDGAVMTTVRDLLKWADNFRSGVVGGEEFLAAMGVRGSLDDGSPLAYGMGLMHDEITTGDGAIPIVHHGGAWVGYRAELLRIPKHDGHTYAIAVLSNRADCDPSGIARVVAEAIVGGAAPRPSQIEEFDVDPDLLTPLFGEYRCQLDESRISLVGEGGRLALVAGRSREALTARGPGVFIRPSDGTLLEVKGAAESGTLRIHLRTDSGPKEFERFEPWKPNADDLASYCGIYRSDEVLATLAVTQESGGGLLFTLSRMMNTTAEPTAMDVFDFPGGAFRFGRDESGRPETCEFRTRGLAGLRFLRRDESAPSIGR